MTASRLGVALIVLCCLTRMATAQYCTPTYITGPAVGDYIQTFALNTLSNTSGQGPASGYEDFTNLSTNLMAGASYTAMVTNNPTWPEHVAIWIDYDQSQTFDANEMIGSQLLTQNAIGAFPFTVPPSALVGPTRLRVMAVYGGATITPCGSFNWGEAEDYTVDILPPLPDDVEMVSIDAPLPLTGTASHTVSVTFRNLGLNTQTAIPFDLSVDGGTPITETWTGSIPSGATGTYTFQSPTPLWFPGLYVFEVTAALPGDGDPTNDVATLNVNTVATIGTFPYVEDFEAGAAGWIAAGAPSSWELGTPAKATIIGAASGQNAWTTGGLTGTYGVNEDSAVFSPCFDLSSLARPEISLQVWWETEATYDGAVLQSSVDGGISWQDVGSAGDPGGWYNAPLIFSTPGGSSQGWSGRTATGNGSGGWASARHALDGLGGAPQVFLRIAFSSDILYQDDGFAFDCVRIQESGFDISQATDQDIAIDVAGAPGATWIALYSLDPANAGCGLGNGPLFGLYLDPLDFLTQVQYALQGIRPHGGTLDAMGLDSWTAIISPGSGGLAGITIYGAALQLGTGSFIAYDEHTFL